jgi:pimeloyl-ACP methyl ester carboxylesterase
MLANRMNVTLSTGTLAYFVLGDGRPLLYLHAAGGPQITPVLEGLAQTHRVFVPIAPGFERTVYHPGIEAVPQLAGLAAEFAQTVIGEATCDVMGHSFGGWVALWLALSHPDRVDHLVLEAPSGLRFGAASTPRSPEELRRKLYAYPEKAKPLLKSPEIVSANADAFARYQAGTLVDEALLGRLSDIKARTLIVLAGRDELIPAKTGQVLKQRIPLSHLAYVYDAAHAIEVDQPKRLLRLVKAFLERGEAYIVNFGDEAA